MGEYIGRESLAADFERCNDQNEKWTPQRVKTLIFRQPPADVAPVVHGRWDDSGRYTFPEGSTAVRCTKCGCALTESEYHLQNWNYCPVCGARMDGARNGETED